MKSDKRFGRVVRASLALLAAVVLMPAQTVLAKPGNAQRGGPPSDQYSVKIVSSAADQVTGGDARLHVELENRAPGQIRVAVNGEPRDARF